MGIVKLTPEQVVARADAAKRRLERPLAEVEREIIVQRRQRDSAILRGLRSAH